MEIIRGTTPTIEITIKNEIDLGQTSQVWIYFSQDSKVKIDKELSDVTFDYEKRIISVRLSQNDTLALRKGDAYFQIRLLLSDGTALGIDARMIQVLEVYKGGIITGGE